MKSKGFKCLRCGAVEYSEEKMAYHIRNHKLEDVKFRISTERCGFCDYFVRARLPGTGTGFCSNEELNMPNGESMVCRSTDICNLFTLQPK